MRKITLHLVFFFALLSQTNAQSLEEYIIDGLRDNVVVQGKCIAIDKAMIALKESKSYFLPAVNFETQYTLAKGGRSIDLPVGDLLNPVYNTLNHLTGSEKFQTISNVSEQFYPNNFNDTRIRTTMPIINPSFKINVLIKSQEIILQENGLESYKRELVKDIKVAYYNFLMADEAIHIYESALVVGKQNLKVNQSLLANGKGLPAYISRAYYQVQTIEQMIQEGLNERQNAKAYFNYLLNRSLNDTVFLTTVQFDEAFQKNIMTVPADIASREELKNMAIALRINHRLGRLNRSFRIPRLNSFIDFGVQNNNFKVNNKSYFYFAGLQLQVPIFTGKRNLYAIQQTLLDTESLTYQWEQVQDHLKLAATVSQKNLQSAYNTYKVSLNQQEPAKSYYHLVDKGYREGINSFLEFLDASKQLVEAQLKLNISKFKLLSASADYERQIASYTFQ